MLKLVTKFIFDANSGSKLRSKFICCNQDNNRELKVNDLLLETFKTVITTKNLYLVSWMY